MGLCGVVLLMLLVVVVVFVLLRVMLLFGFRFWFGVGFLVGVRLEVEVRGVMPGCLGCLFGGRGASSSFACGSGFGFGRGFVDEVGREGGVGGGGRGRR